MELRRTTGHSEATRKYTVTPYAKIRRGDNTVFSTRQGDIHSHSPNYQMDHKTIEKLIG